MRSGAKVAVVGGVFAVVAGGVGYGGYNLWNGVTGGDSAVATRSEAVPEKRSGPVTPEETTATAKDFLAAWAAGESDRAAQLTNDPVAAGPALLAYKEGAKVSKAVITPGRRSAPRCRSRCGRRSRTRACPRTCRTPPS